MPYVQVAVGNAVLNAILNLLTFSELADEHFPACLALCNLSLTESNLSKIQHAVGFKHISRLLGGSWVKPKWSECTKVSPNFNQRKHKQSYLFFSLSLYILVVAVCATGCGSVGLDRESSATIWSRYPCLSPSEAHLCRARTSGAQYLRRHPISRLSLMRFPRGCKSRRKADTCFHLANPHRSTHTFELEFGDDCKGESEGRRIRTVA